MRAIVCLALAGLVACQSAGTGNDTPIHYDVGVVQRDVTTSSADAQLWFDRGLGLTYGFNHEEAIVCFEMAAAADPQCAMAHWGKAYALGPNYNDVEMPPEKTAAANEALALAATGNANDAERALILALERRYASDAPEDRAQLNADYAQAMREVRAAYPDDDDVTALCAEALMMLRPWKLWSPEGVPAPETPEIRGVLEAGLARWPNHPALCHLYIHAMEAGPEVAKAIPVARTLESLTPGLGHLIHMPSHIYTWTGDYDEVVRVNLPNLDVTHPPDAHDRDVAGGVDPRLHGDQARQRELHLLEGVRLQLPAHDQAVAPHLESNRQGRMGQAEQLGQGDPHLGPSRVRTHGACEHQVECQLADRGAQAAGDPDPVRALEALLVDEDRLVGPHGQSPSQHVLAVLVPQGDHGDPPAVALLEADRLLDRVAVPLVDGLHQVLALDVDAVG